MGTFSIWLIGAGSVGQPLVLALIPPFWPAKKALTTSAKNRRCTSIFGLRGAVTLA
jgi:hypothetical protein